MRVPVLSGDLQQYFVISATGTVHTPARRPQANGKLATLNGRDELSRLRNMAVYGDIAAQTEKMFVDASIDRAHAYGYDRWVWPDADWYDNNKYVYDEDETYTPMEMDQEDCATINRDLEYNDVSCTSVHAALCERLGSSIPPSPPPLNALSGYVSADCSSRMRPCASPPLRWCC